MQNHCYSRSLELDLYKEIGAVETIEGWEMLVFIMVTGKILAAIHRSDCTQHAITKHEMMKEEVDANSSYKLFSGVMPTLTFYSEAWKIYKQK